MLENLSSIVFLDEIDNNIIYALEEVKLILKKKHFEMLIQPTENNHGNDCDQVEYLI